MKKHFNKKNEEINKRLMESWGYTKKEGLNDAPDAPVIYKAAHNAASIAYYKQNPHANVVDADKHAMLAGMRKVLEDGNPLDAAAAEELLGKLPRPTTAAGGSNKLYDRFQDAKKEAIKQLFPMRGIAQ